ncbi:hypothetical protein BKA83DRAFT_4125595 [Pisolithus microcarpus]|nr:hypothetical protein BKA83DRAFT_4125595 [Pisolithus microcarpus]
MGVEILQVPGWDFSNSLTGGWRISNWSFGDSPWVWRFSKCQNGTSPILLWGDEESPIVHLEILHGCGDSPTARMGFLHPSYVGMGILQVGSCGFSMGMEIPQIPEWDFPMTIMWQWRISNWSFGDSPWVWRFSKCQNGTSPILLWSDGEFPTGHLEILHGCGDSPTARMGLLQFSYGGMGNLQLGSWRFSNCQNRTSPIFLWGDGEFPIRWLEILHGCGDSPTARMGFLHPSYGGMGNVQLGSWEFPMGVEILKVPK